MGDDAQGGKKQRPAKAALAALLVAVLLLGTGLWYYYYYRNPLGTSASVNVLLIGQDAGDNGDAFVVASLNPNTGDTTLLSLPKNTVAGDPAAGARTIGEIYAEGGQDSVRPAIEELLNISIPYYVYVDYGGFVELVDAIGGVEVEVDDRIVYRDAGGKVVFELDEGRHHLDGRSALYYVRYWTASAGESGRLDRHEKFLESAVAQVLSGGTVKKSAELVKIVSQSVRTDMSFELMARSADFLRRHGLASVRTEVVPGETTGEVYVLRPLEVEALVTSVFE